jgi:hypothetical protein
LSLPLKLIADVEVFRGGDIKAAEDIKKGFTTNLRS